MLRLVEIALFLSPFVFFAIWRAVGTDGGPSVRVVAAAACVLALLAGTLVWLSLHQALPPGTAYAPAHLEDGRIVSGHAVPR
ncbi:MAG TPA: DUF6111 family protein [Acetobacteraceae bacterium]|jgi:hypothetical protein|nr:DUF6111 family protein [Acetobacteraceae bacterium]